MLFALPAELIVGTAVALLLHNSPHRKIFLPALLLPIVATPIVVGFIFKYMYQEDYGLISFFMKLLHIFPGFNLTSQIHTVLLALAFVDFWEWTPFVMLIMLAGFNGIPVSVTEAANLDGASGWTRLWFIELPMLRAEFLVALLFRTVDIIRVYDIIYATTRGGPGAFSESASVYLQTVAFKFRDLGYASAFGFTLVLLGVALATLYLRVARPRDRSRHDVRKMPGEFRRSFAKSSAGPRRACRPLPDHAVLPGAGDLGPHHGAEAAQGHLQQSSAVPVPSDAGKLPVRVEEQSLRPLLPELTDRKQRLRRCQHVHRRPGCLRVFAVQGPSIE